MDRYAGWSVFQETLPAGGIWGKVTLCPSKTCTTTAEFQTADYCNDFKRPCDWNMPEKYIILDHTGLGRHFERTDANLVTTTYTYNAESQLTPVYYPDSSFNVTFSYDEGANKQYIY
jgi:YD repeat-containing protein